LPLCFPGGEATSGGQVCVNVFDAPQSISVIPLDLIADLGL
jgi:hypothetical protein